MQNSSFIFSVALYLCTAVWGHLASLLFDERSRNDKIPVRKTAGITIHINCLGKKEIKMIGPGKLIKSIYYLTLSHFTVIYIAGHPRHYG